MTLLEALIGVKPPMPFLIPEIRTAAAKHSGGRNQRLSRLYRDGAEAAGTPETSWDSADSPGGLPRWSQQQLDHLSQ